MPLNSIYSVNLWIKHNSCLIWRCSLVCLNMALSTWVTELKGCLPRAVKKGRVRTCILVAYSLVNGVLSGALCFFYLQTEKSQQVTEELQFLYPLCGIVVGQTDKETIGIRGCLLILRGKKMRLQGLFHWAEPWTPGLHDFWLVICVLGVHPGTQ